MEHSVEEKKATFYQIISVSIDTSNKFEDILTKKGIQYQKIFSNEKSCIFFVNAKETLIQILKDIKDYNFYTIETDDLINIIEIFSQEKFFIDSIDLLQNDDYESNKVDKLKEFFLNNNIYNLREMVRNDHIQLDKVKLTKDGIKFTLYNTGLFISNLSIDDLTSNMKRIFSVIQ